MSGVIPQVAALMGPCAAGHRLHPGARGLRADGQGARLDGARRPAPRTRGDRRGRHPGGARRLARSHAPLGGRRPRGPRRRGLHPVDQGLPVVHALQLRAAPAAQCRRPTRWTAATTAARRGARLQPQALRHVRRHPPDRRRRRVVRPQAGLGQDGHHLPRALRRAPGGDRGQPAAPARRDPRQRLGRQGRALRQPLQRVRDPARVPPGRARASWSAPRSSRPGSSATGRRCSTPWPRRPSRRSRSCSARPTAPATTSCAGARTSPT